ncbi:MAG: hypothetical protein H0V07_06020 [Propionibacteriales bacterium]|nr:hypothetical protein [Propionibacteriales bacterium]
MNDEGPDSLAGRGGDPADDVVGPASPAAGESSTGDERVDAALDRLRELDEADVDEHAATYDEIHRALTAVLDDTPRVPPPDAPPVDPSDVPAVEPFDVPPDAPSGVPAVEPFDVPPDAPSGVPPVEPSDVPPDAPSGVPPGTPPEQ